MSQDPEFGPSGYLPERAAKRGRKIVLREPLGVGWIVASVIAAVAMLVVGLAYVVFAAGPPGEPYVQAATLEDIDPRGAEVMEVRGLEVLVVRGGGGVQAFEAPSGDVRWCRESRRLEAADGRVWDTAGQLRGGPGTSLRPLRVEAHDGLLFVDPQTRLEPPAEADAGEEPACPTAARAGAQARTRGA